MKYRYFSKKVLPSCDLELYEGVALSKIVAASFNVIDIKKSGTMAIS